MSTGAARVPLFLDLTGRSVVVVGAGPVAARKVTDLLAAGADVTVVAPRSEPAIRAAADRARLRWRQRAYRAGDLAGAWLVVTATGVPEVDRRVVADADRDRIWAVDCTSAGTSPAWGGTTVPAEDGVAVAVSGGGDPRRARSVARDVRRLIDDGGLSQRRQRTAGSRGGRVHLVGGGPGDPDLLTVRARRLLALADVVVMDRLAPWPALAELDDDVEVIDVGKSPGNHAMSQERINEVLIERARAGKVVVRLKGGDPFVLGRGGEEALACLAAGVPVSVVPGVTSAVSVPAAAGIPVTHRGVAASFAMVSAHTAAEALARAQEVSDDTTLVLLMGVRALPAVAAGLVAAGRSPLTPVAIVERGWQPGQRTTVGTLADIAERAVAAGVQSPAVIVVGEVVAVGQQIAAGMAHLGSDGLVPVDQALGAPVPVAVLEAAAR